MIFDYYRNCRNKVQASPCAISGELVCSVSEAAEKIETIHRIPDWVNGGGAREPSQYDYGW